MSLFTVHEKRQFWNEQYTILFSSKKNNLHKIFVEKLRSTEFPDYSNHASVNDAYQDFVRTFLHVVDSVAPIKTLIRYFFISKKLISILKLRCLKK